MARAGGVPVPRLDRVSDFGGPGAPALAPPCGTPGRRDRPRSAAKQPPGLRKPGRLALGSDRSRCGGVLPRRPSRALAVCFRSRGKGSGTCSSFRRGFFGRYGYTSTIHVTLRHAGSTRCNQSSHVGKERPRRLRHGGTSARGTSAARPRPVRRGDRAAPPAFAVGRRQAWRRGCLEDRQDDPFQG